MLLCYSHRWPVWVSRSGKVALLHMGEWIICMQVWNSYAKHPVFS
jgi:hypothetical protein